MADFLTNLAGRTLGVMPIAQPIVGSRFAPQAAPMFEPAIAWETFDEQAPVSSDERYDSGQGLEQTGQEVRREPPRTPLRMAEMATSPRTNDSVMSGEERQVVPLVRSNDFSRSPAPKTSEAFREPRRTARQVATSREERELVSAGRRDDASMSLSPRTASAKVVATPSNEPSTPLRASEAFREPRQRLVTTPRASEVAARHEKREAVNTTRRHESAPSSNFSHLASPKRGEVVATDYSEPSMSLSPRTASAKVVTTPKVSEVVAEPRTTKAFREPSRRLVTTPKVSEVVAIPRTSDVVATPRTSEAFGEPGRRLVTTRHNQPLADTSPPRTASAKVVTTSGQIGNQQRRTEARQEPIVNKAQANMSYHANHEPISAFDIDRKPEPPTIRVTIGRIEVRAQQPAQKKVAKRAARARPQPALSLNDYLKQRAGGRR